MRILESVDDPRQFGYFGCPVAGLHIDKFEANKCQRCMLAPGVTSPSTPFDDDRGNPPYWSFQSRKQTWPHRRWLDGYGRLHREHDEPALAGEGWKIWASRGRIRRSTGPSVVLGDDNWAYTNDAGYLDREDGPAICWNKELNWVRDGVLTRPDGAAVIHPNNREPEYWLDGKLIASRDELWARWLEPYRVDLDNVEAQQHLLDVLDVSEAATAVFPEPDLLSVRLALRLFPNC
ncbi:hypothetical protein [Demequina aurantiaca]|uniref:hypothetical protein n=1 Tax=Demequina aurantiaca TaxID=676200 RepID=UPI003D35618B